MENRSISARIKALRKSKRMTQQMLANSAGLSLPYIKKIENDGQYHRNPGPDAVKKLAGALGVAELVINPDMPPTTKQRELLKKMDSLSEHDQAVIEALVEQMINTRLGHE